MAVQGACCGYNCQAGRQAGRLAGIATGRSGKKYRDPLFPRLTVGQTAVSYGGMETEAAKALVQPALGMIAPISRV